MVEKNSEDSSGQEETKEISAEGMQAAANDEVTTHGAKGSISSRIRRQTAVVARDTQLGSSHAPTALSRVIIETGTDTPQAESEKKHVFGVMAMSTLRIPKVHASELPPEPERTMQVAGSPERKRWENAEDKKMEGLMKARL